MCLRWIGSGLVWCALAGGAAAQQPHQAISPAAFGVEAAPVCAEEPAGAASDRHWVQGDYLLWWLSRAPVSAPLITTGPTATQGVLGQPGVQVLYGGSSVGFGPVSGLRLGGGAWLDCERQLGLEANGFLLERTGVGTALGSNINGSPLLATPFFRVGRDGVGETTLRSSSPGQFVGGTGVALSNRMWGAEANGLWRSAADSPFQALVGFRSVSLEETLERITNNQTLGALRTDQFGTQNHFYGVQIGGRGDWRADRFDVNLSAKVALGCMRETVSLNGDLDRPDSTILPGGILVGSNRIGTSSENHFAVVPEVRVQAGYAILDNLRGFVGYNALYLSSVARPGDQIDRVVDTAAIPSAASRFTPAPPPPGSLPVVRSTDFWAQGLNFGLEFRY